jgi:hypothetical protein
MRFMRGPFQRTAGSPRSAAGSNLTRFFAVGSADSSESQRCKNPHILLFILYNSVIRRDPHLADPGY